MKKQTYKVNSTKYKQEIDVERVMNVKYEFKGDKKKLTLINYYFNTYLNVAKKERKKWTWTYLSYAALTLQLCFFSTSVKCVDSQRYLYIFYLCKFKLGVRNRYSPCSRFKLVDYINNLA